MILLLILQKRHMTAAVCKCRYFYIAIAFSVHKPVFAKCKQNSLVLFYLNFPHECSICVCVCVCVRQSFVYSENIGLEQLSLPYISLKRKIRKSAQGIPFSYI